jgi:hypothetical protein
LTSEEPADRRLTRIASNLAVARSLSGPIIIIAVLVSFSMRTFAFQTFFIPSGSMEPTLQVGDRIIVNKLSVTFGHHQHGRHRRVQGPARPRTAANRSPTSSSVSLECPVTRSNPRATRSTLMASP